MGKQKLGVPISRETGQQQGRHQENTALPLRPNAETERSRTLHALLSWSNAIALSAHIIGLMCSCARSGAHRYLKKFGIVKILPGKTKTDSSASNFRKKSTSSVISLNLLISISTYNILVSTTTHISFPPRIWRASTSSCHANTGGHAAP